MADESFVQVAPDGSGKRIRNLQVQALQPDGSIVPVQIQVVAIADEAGNDVPLTVEHDIRQQTLDELRAIRVGIQMLVDWLNPAASVITHQPIAQVASRGTMLLPTTSEENELIEIARDMRADEVA